MYVALHYSPVQTWLVKKVSDNLSEKLHTEVKVEHVDLDFFKNITAEGVLVKDLKKDTLISVGRLSGKMNDWFFLKDTININNVLLCDVVVNLNRTDSVWNYKFLVDYFSSPKTNKKKTSSNFNIDLNELHFKNIKYNKIDKWIGDDMIGSIGKLDLVMDKLDLNKKLISIKEIILDKPYFAQNDYDGNKPPNFNKKTKIIVADTNKFDWNKEQWNISLAKLTLTDGTYKNDKQSSYKPYTDKFDGMHLLFSKLNGTVENVKFVDDTLHSNIELNGYEKSGLEIKKLNAKLKLTPKIMEFKDLTLETNKSKLGNYFAMEYNDFIPDFNGFIEKVSLNCNFKNSYINSNDLAIFAPELKKWNRIFFVEGKSTGTVDNFEARELNIKSGNTLLNGNLALKGLPDIENTLITLHSNNLNTSYNELSPIIPQLKEVTNPSLQSLGNINFVGDFKGYLTDFAANGKLKTALGNATANIKMNMLSGAIPTYAGTIQSDGFNIGQFIKTKELGNIALDVKVDGAGFNIKDLKETIVGKIGFIKVGNYTYNNIDIDGTIVNKKFRGHTAIADANLKISTLDGEIDFNDATPGFNLTTSVQKADFKTLGLISEDFNFEGDLDVNFKGNNIDNFIGTADIKNATLLKGSKKLSFDFLKLNSQIINGKKSLTVNTNELDANITGTFKVAEIPDAVSFLLVKYYPTYIKAPAKKVTSIQNFNYDITTKNIDEYAGLIDKKLTGFNNSHFNGSFDLQAYNIQLNATVPQFEYDKKIFNNIKLNSVGTGENLLTDITVDEIKLTDSLSLPFSKLNIDTKNDVSVIKLNTSASKIFGNAELNASITTIDDGVKINFFPSSFIINNKKWQLEKDGELLLSKSLINASEVKFFSGNQAIVLSTGFDDDGSTNDKFLIAKLTNINASDFAFILPKNPKLKGIVSGEARVTKILEDPKITFKGFADSVNVDGEQVGKVDAEFNLNTKTGNIDFTAKTNEKKYKFNVTGNINLNDTTGAGIDINVEVDTLYLAILKPYLTSVFSDLDGYAVGKVRIAKQNKKLSIVGNPIIKEGNFTIGYTQVKYHIKNQPIVFGKRSIELNGINVTDNFENKGMLGGIIYHDFFDNFYFDDVRFSTNKMQVLNTTKKDNQQFYGKIIGRANMSLNGPIANMKMIIDGEPSPSEIDSNHVVLLTGDSKENGAIDYIDFIQFGTQMDKDASQKGASNLLVDLKIKANPFCKVDVVLDEDNGDVVKGQGKGELNIRVGTTEPLSMRGRYDITKGDYTYNFQTLISKPFTVNGGSITWNGDPLLAILDIDAEYLVKNVDLTSINLSGGRLSEDIIVKTKLIGNLKKPGVSLGLTLTEKSANKNNVAINGKFNQYKSDENEINRQVVSLLLIGQLITQEQSFLSGGSLPSLVTGTLGSYVSTWLTGLLNKQLSKATNGIVSIAVDLNPTINAQTAAFLQAQIRSSLQFKVSKNIKVLVGGSFEAVNNPFTQLYGNAVKPDVTVEWLINKDGSIRMLLNRRSTADVTNGQRNRNSLQIGYKKDVDRLGDFFRSKKRIAYLDSLKIVKENKNYRSVIYDSASTK